MPKLNSFAKIYSVAVIIQLYIIILLGLHYIYFKYNRLVQWNLPHPELYYPGTSIVRAPPLSGHLHCPGTSIVRAPPLSGHLHCPGTSIVRAPPLSGHFHCSGTSIVQTAQISHVACSLLTIMKFGLDESTRREPKGCCLPV